MHSFEARLIERKSTADGGMIQSPETMTALDNVCQYNPFSPCKDILSGLKNLLLPGVEGDWMYAVSGTRKSANKYFKPAQSLRRVPGPVKVAALLNAAL